MVSPLRRWLTHHAGIFSFRINVVNSSVDSPVATLRPSFVPVAIAIPFIETVYLTVMPPNRAPTGFGLVTMRSLSMTDVEPFTFPKEFWEPTTLGTLKNPLATPSAMSTSPTKTTVNATRFVVAKRVARRFRIVLAFEVEGIGFPSEVGGSHPATVPVAGADRPPGRVPHHNPIDFRLSTQYPE